MYNFKTKYKSCLTATDELQYIKFGDTPPNAFKENAPREKKANYTISNRMAIGNSKHLPINQGQLTGKGIDSSKRIFNEPEINANDAYTSLGKISGWSKRRLFKREGIIYDLIN